eukprot:1178882-Prorocentrum_minimum.AAC.1
MRTPPGVCEYMIPEYEREELERALQWAVVWSASEPTCVLAVYPNWKRASRYMNLLNHPHNVQVLARFARGTFAFLPPDHSGRATQIADASRRTSYARGGGELVEEAAGRTIGAKPVVVRTAQTPTLAGKGRCRGGRTRRMTSAR